MRKHVKSRPLSLLIAAVLFCILLPLLAFLQHHWLGLLSVWEIQQMKEELLAGMSGMCREFDGKLSLLYLFFKPTYITPGREVQFLAGKQEEWAGHSSETPMVESVFLLTIREADGLRVFKLDLEASFIEETELPAEMAQFQSYFLMAQDFSADETLSRISPLQDDIPALFIPQTRREDSRNWVVVVLNRDHITKELLPELERDYFSPEGQSQFYFAVVSKNAPGEIIYSTSTFLTTEDFQRTDASFDLFGLHPQSLNTQPAQQDSRGVLRQADNARQAAAVGGLFGNLVQNQQHEQPPRIEGQWLLLARHHSGSLASAAVENRFRNLMISFGFLLLLGGSVFAVILVARRSHRLARQQVEFVAGVAHELRTPLAVITTAGQNLADNLVKNREKTRVYGRMIEKEGRRLSEIVENLLFFSGLLTGKRIQDLQPLQVPDVINGAIALIDETDIKVTKELPENLPMIMGDRRALQTAVRNLIANAIKYSPRVRKVRVWALEMDTPRREVQICVGDWGIGISPSEMPYIFEPFFRGGRARELNIDGSGLGLSLVKHIVEGHKGRVSVSSFLNEGSTFTIHLAAAHK